MRCDYTIYLAKYAHNNDLLGNPGWKQLRCYVKKTKNMNRLLKAAKDNQRRNTVKIKFDTKITREHKEAMMFDTNNGNTNWKDAKLLELKKIYNFDPLNSIELVISARIPTGYTKIQVHIIYDCK